MRSLIMSLALVACTEVPSSTPQPTQTWGGIVVVEGCPGETVLWLTQGSHGGTWTCPYVSTTSGEHGTGLGTFTEIAGGLRLDYAFTYTLPDGTSRHVRGAKDVTSDARAQVLELTDVTETWTLYPMD